MERRKCTIMNVTEQPKFKSSVLDLSLYHLHLICIYLHTVVRIPYSKYEINQENHIRYLYTH